MRIKLLIPVLLCGSLMSAYAAPGPGSRPAMSKLSASSTSPAAEVPVDKNKASYSVGFTLGTNLSKQFTGLNQDELLKGLTDAFSGKEGKYSKEEMTRMIMSYQREIMQERLVERKEQAEKNKKEGDAFLAVKKKEKGVKLTNSGLLYKVIKSGQGKSPEFTDKVRVTYVGTLIDGKEFSSQTDVNNPAEFSLEAVIPAWREALQLMKPGATWELYVPPNLAYGARGTAGDIGPNATLIFKISLISVEKAADETKTTSSDKSSTLPSTSSSQTR